MAVEPFGRRRERVEAMTMAYWGYMHLPEWEADDIQVF
jgi:hypothetical protein